MSRSPPAVVSRGASTGVGPDRFLEASTAGPSRRDQLERCVRWPDLWDGGGAPPRDEVRRALEAFDYRPVPKGS